MSRPPWDLWDTEGAWDTSWHAEEDPTAWERSCDASGSWAEGSWEQSQTCHMWGHEKEAYHRQPHHQPWSGDRRRTREPGNGYQPKANDPDGWQRGENRPSEKEYEFMIYYGPDWCGKKVKNQFKAYTQREEKKMEMEDMMSGLRTFAEREKEKSDAATELHLAEMDHQMEAAITAKIEIERLASPRFASQRFAVVEVEVEVLPPGAQSRRRCSEEDNRSTNGGPLGWREHSKVQPESRANMDGRHGTAHRSFRGNNSVSKHASMPECQE